MAADEKLSALSEAPGASGELAARLLPGRDVETSLAHRGGKKRCAPGADAKAFYRLAAAHRPFIAKLFSLVLPDSPLDQSFALSSGYKAFWRSELSFFRDVSLRHSEENRDKQT